MTLDELTTWATETSRLRDLEILPEDATVPWVVCLSDLMAVVDLLDGAQLIHYLIRRQRLERHGRVSAHDELDWVGHYIAEGLHFDWALRAENPPDKLRLTSYTDPIDAWYFTRAGLRTNKSPKPTQPIPLRLRSILKRLAVDRPEHWLTASVALLDGDDDSHESWERSLQHIEKTVQKTGMSNASQGFDGRFGITLYLEHRHAEANAREMLRGYCERKAHEFDRPLWIGIGKSFTAASLFVVLFQASGVKISDVFLG